MLCKLGEDREGIQIEIFLHYISAAPPFEGVRTHVRLGQSRGSKVNAAAKRFGRGGVRRDQVRADGRWVSGRVGGWLSGWAEDSRAGRQKDDTSVTLHQSGHSKSSRWWRHATAQKTIGIPTAKGGLTNGPVVCEQ